MYSIIATTLRSTQQDKEWCMNGRKAAGCLFVSAIAVSALVGCAPDAGEQAGDSSDPCQGVTLTYIGLEGEGGEVELEEWRTARSTRFESSWPGDFSQMIAAIMVGQTFDLATLPYHQAGRMIESGALQPIDVDALENWDRVVPALADNPEIRGTDGQVYGVPIAWGDGPFIYNPATVGEVPTSIRDLLDPSWSGRFVLPDSPDLPFAFLALSLGHDPTAMSPEELAEVEQDAQALVDNAAAFSTGYQDANDRLIAGDVDLSVAGWEAQVSWAEERGVELAYDFFGETRSGWWDALAIPATADNPECALEYIDQMISAPIQAAVATNLLSGTTNIDAIDLVGDEAQMYDYDLVLSTDNTDDLAGLTPPEETDDGTVTYQEWLDAWQRVKAG
jgi:spermidine/putrescine-binding protein